MSVAMAQAGVGLAEAKDRFSSLTRQANLSGASFTVLKGGMPWVEVVPLASRARPDYGVHIRPVPSGNSVVPDLDDLFRDYEGSFRPVEDGLAGPVGLEEL